MVGSGVSVLFSSQSQRCFNPHHISFELNNTFSNRFSRYVIVWGKLYNSGSTRKCYGPNVDVVGCFYCLRS